MILMTRPARYSRAFHRALEDVVQPIIDVPLLHPVPTGPMRIETSGYDALIFTSRVAVEEAGSRLGSFSQPAYAVGPGTGEALREAGFHVVHEAEGTAQQLADLLAEATFRRGLYISGEDVTLDLSALFPGRIDRLPVYVMEATGGLPDHVADAITSAKDWVAPLYSRRSAEVFADLVNEAGLRFACRRATAIGISQKALLGADLPWRQVGLSATPDADGMVAAVRRAA